MVMVTVMTVTMTMMISHILPKCRRHWALRNVPRPDVKNNVHYAEELWEKTRIICCFYTLKPHKSPIISLVNSKQKTVSSSGHTFIFTGLASVYSRAKMWTDWNMSQIANNKIHDMICIL